MGFYYVIIIVLFDINIAGAKIMKKLSTKTLIFGINSIFNDNLNTNYVF
jgi:hypothetical protein